MHLISVQTLEKQVKYSLIGIFRLLKQILRSLARLFSEKYSQYLKLFHHLELFARSHDRSSFRESTVDFFWRISYLCSR